MKSRLVGVALGLFILQPLLKGATSVDGWLSWRGPNQNGTSQETGLPDKIDPQNPLWKVSYPGQSTSVIANGKVYIMGYVGDGPDLQEGVACFDAETGKQLWHQGYTDFLSDVIYGRYATSSPTIDPETGNVHMQGAQGILATFTPDGKLVWNHSLMEEYGRLTFPNSRTGSPVIDNDLVITRGITANWGAQGPGGDRFYAFDKRTGELVWSSSPSDRPKDNSFSHPYLGWLGERRVLYAALGDGSVACINARNGEPIWRVPLFKAGINATVCVHNNDKIIAIYGTPYEPGQMVALRIKNVPPTNAASGPVIIERAEVQLWANDISTSTTSPILVGDRIYVVSEKGDLCSVDVNSGKILWKLKIGIEQRNACPLYADGKLYVPMLEDPGSSAQQGARTSAAAGSEETKGQAQGATPEAAGGEVREARGTKGAFYIIKPDEKDPQILQHAVLEGRCFGTPTAYNGKIYVQTTRYLYCFGKKGNNPGLAKPVAQEPWPKPGPAAQLQIIPSEVLLRPGQSNGFRVRSLDANGLLVEEIKDPASVKWASYIPPTARVKSTMNASFNAEGKLVAADDTKPSAGAFEAMLGNLKGYIRGRALPYLPIQQDFEWATLNETNTAEGEAFAYPPLPWIGARFKFDIRDRHESKVLNKTIDNKFFQRATVFLGHPESRNYTIEADVMSEGNRRKMSEVGLINQRYFIILKGNEQKLEINSNLERLRYPPAEAPPNFRWSPNAWYRLKARVDVAPDGSGVVRAKAWKKSDPEPEQWTLEVPHKYAHQNGSPGLFGFSPQDMRVYIDNISVAPNN